MRMNREVKEIETWRQESEGEIRMSFKHENAEVCRVQSQEVMNDGKQKVSVFNSEGPPVPIPNTEVKLVCADNTWLEATREDRSMLTPREVFQTSLGFDFLGKIQKKTLVQFLIPNS